MKLILGIFSLCMVSAALAQNWTPVESGDDSNVFISNENGKGLTFHVTHSSTSDIRDFLRKNQALKSKIKCKRDPYYGMDVCTFTISPQGTLK